VFGRKISLRPPMMLPADRAAQSWEGLTGFGHWEGPYPEWKLPRCRWQDNVRATFHVTTSSSGAHTLVLRFRNLVADQHLRISCGGKTLFDGRVLVTPHQQETLLRMDVHLDAPRTLIRCEATRSSTGPDGRTQVLLWFGVETLPKFSLTPGHGGELARWKRILRLPRRVFAWLSRNVS
jgi:hypothetical protein